VQFLRGSQIFKLCGVGKKVTHHFSQVLVQREMIHVEMSLVGSSAIHMTECPSRSGTWVDEDEERRYDGGMRFVSIALASASRPIVRIRAI